MSGSEPRDLSLLIAILQTHQRHVREGKTPRYLYLPEGGTHSLADDVAWMIRQHDEASAWLASMVLVERPNLGALSAYVTEEPLRAD